MNPIDRDTEGFGDMFTFPLDDDDLSGKRISCEVDICSDPLCPCMGVTFSYGLHDDALGEASSENVPTVSFTIDVAERAIVDREQLSPELLEFAEKFRTNIKETQWRELYQQAYLYKEHITETSDVSGCDVTFPIETVEDPSIMVPYKEVFPFARPFPFELDGHDWLVDEHHCVNPRCDCRDVIVNFLQMDLSDGDHPRVITRWPHAIYDTQRKTFTPGKDPWGKEPSLEALSGALLEHNPDFAAKMRSRRSTLRGLFKKARRSFAPRTTPLPLPKAGPNDPCPCGSGRKHKKCCGRIV